MSRTGASRAAAAAVLCGIVCLAYANALDGGFVLDSKALILRDPRVHAATPANLELIWERSYWWPYGESGLYRPATTLSYLANYAAFGNGDQPFWYHAFNLAVHCLNVLLAFALLLRLTQKRWLSFSVAALWSVHPLSVEAVTNIVGRSDLMAGLGVLGGLLAYVSAREASSGQRVVWLVVLSAATGLGVFSKESAVVLIGLIGLYEIAWWNVTGSPRRLAAATIAMAPPLILFWVQRASVLRSSPGAEFVFTDNPIVGAEFWTGRLTAAQVVARYVALLFWPGRLSADYSYPQIPLSSGDATDWIALSVIAAIAVISMARLRHQHPWSFFLLWGFVTLLPASNVLFATGTIMGERLMYLPSLGWIAFIVGVPWTMLERRVRPLILVPVVAGLTIALGLRTWTRNADWQSDLVLWTATIQSSPESAKAHRALAEALYDTDPSHADIDAVIAHAERSVALLAGLPVERDSFPDHRQLGGYLLDKANVLERRAGGDTAATRPLYVRANAALSRALAIAEAARARMPTASVSPEADVRRLRAAALLGLKDVGAAAIESEQARHLEPMHPLAYRLSADASLGAGRADDAAVMLMVGSMVTGDATLGRDLIGLYRAAFSDGCAVVDTVSGPVLNPSCPVVRQHVCAATVEAVRVSTTMGRVDQARRLQETATSQFSCQ